LQVNRNRWIELKRVIGYAELAASPLLADELFAQVGSVGLTA